MKEAAFERKGKNITDLESKKTVSHESINAAKRWSRAKQIEMDGRQGAGSVRRVR